MGFFKRLFQSREEIWQQFADEIGGELIGGGFFRSKKVVARFDNWTVVLDIFSRSSGKHSTTYTRIRAPFKTIDELQFKIYRSGIFSEIGKAFGMQDISTDDLAFDEEFVIKGNDEDKISEIFSIGEIKNLINSQDRISLEIKDDKGIFNSNLSKGNYELYFETVGVIKDIDRLKDLFMLFALMLNVLALIGSASKEEIDIELK